MNHELNNDLILFGRLGDAVVAVEVLRVVHAYVAHERLVEAERHTARNPAALVVV